MSQRSNISPRNKNETERAKYSEEWHSFNLRTQRFGESKTTNFTALPQLKRQRKQRSDVTHPHCHMPDVRPTASSTGVTRAAEDFGGHPAAAGTDYIQEEMPLLETSDLYFQLILETNCISACDEFFTVFVLNDLNYQNFVMKTNKFVLIRKKAMCFRGVWDWAYQCSCDQARSQVFQSASVHIHQKMEDHSYTAASAEDMCPLLADFYKVQDDLPDVLIPVLEELGRLSKAPLFQHQQPYQRVSKQIVSPLMKLAMNFVALLFGLTCHRRNTEESTQWT